MVSQYHSGFVSLWRNTPSILESSFRLLLPSTYSQLMVSYSWPFCLMNILYELPEMGWMCYILLNIVTQKWKKEHRAWRQVTRTRQLENLSSEVEKEGNNKSRLSLWLRGEHMVSFCSTSLLAWTLCTLPFNILLAILLSCQKCQREWRLNSFAPFLVNFCNMFGSSYLVIT